MIQSKYFCSVAFESLGCFETQNTISVRMWHSYWFQSGRQLKFPVVELALGQIQWMLPFPPPPQHGHDHHCGQPLPLSPSSSAASLTPSAPSLLVASLTPSLSTQIIFQNHRTKGHLNGIQTLKYSGRIWQKSMEKNWEVIDTRWQVGRVQPADTWRWGGQIEHIKKCNFAWLCGKLRYLILINCNGDWLEALQWRGKGSSLAPFVMWTPHCGGLVISDYDAITM